MGSGRGIERSVRLASPLRGINWTSANCFLSLSAKEMMMVDSGSSLLQSGFQIYQTQGFRQLAREAFYYGYESVLRAGCSLFGDRQGDNIYEDDWDVLIILDACRIDLLREVTGEYPFLKAIETRRSVGSTSAEWMDNTFTTEHRDAVADTIYVTGNPFSDGHVSAEKFAVVDEVWRNKWDAAAETIRPRPLTDRAITQWRSQTNADRMIVHYMQPHYPFIGSSIGGAGLSLENWGETFDSRNVWELLRDDEIEHDALWHAYRENLRTVLNDVEFLLETIDAGTVAITADHGNAVGEYGVYGHPAGICLSALRDVPWVTMSAEQVREYEPETTNESPTNENVSDRLEALGYK